jgi:hypothetical protein
MEANSIDFRIIYSVNTNKLHMPLSFIVLQNEMWSIPNEDTVEFSKEPK